VIGGSAGGLSALIDLVRNLPADLPAALCVSLHTSAESPGLLPDIVGRKTKMSCAYAQDGQALSPGIVYFAPPDRHLLVSDHTLRVTHGPRENGFRPAVDPLFRTAARAYEKRVAGVVLSGSLGDGSAGLAIIKQAGGISIVQDPEEALFPSMPSAAIAGVDIDHVVRAAEIGPLIMSLTNGSSLKGAAMSRDASVGIDSAERGTDLSKQMPEGDLTPFTCPECGGSLWEKDDGRQIRFRCHVGHAFNAESLVQYVTEEVESALWTALRILEEHALLQERMAARSEGFELAASAAQFRSRASDSRRQAEQLRNVLMNQSPPASAENKPTE
jgi:two-component system chemotaxis response regulator CheB